jgi:hypothetical protein
MTTELAYVTIRFNQTKNKGRLGGALYQVSSQPVDPRRRSLRGEARSRLSEISFAMTPGLSN